VWFYGSQSGFQGPRAPQLGELLVPDSRNSVVSLPGMPHEILFYSSQEENTCAKTLIDRPELAIGASAAAPGKRLDIPQDRGKRRNIC
jgi:hypothetical protein